MKFSSLCLAAALTVVSVGASASTLQIDQIDKEQTTFTQKSGSPFGAFSELYLFKLNPADFSSGSALVSFALTELKVGTRTNINFAPVVFSRDEAGTDIIWQGTTSAASYAGADVLSTEFFVDVPKFYLTIAGNAIGTGLNSGSYSYEITAGVPEPSTYGLMLGGMALVGWTLKRRQQA